MKYFVGVVPPGNISYDIFGIQKQFGNNRLEPHITVIPPVALTSEALWLQAIEETAQEFCCLKIELIKTGMFGKGVLYIDVASEDLMRLNERLITVLNPFEEKLSKQAKHDKYHPHLTLGRRWCGFTSEGFLEMQALADAYLTAKVEFTACFLRVYCKAKSNETYKILRDVPLSKC